MGGGDEALEVAVPAQDPDLSIHFQRIATPGKGYHSPLGKGA